MYPGVVVREGQILGLSWLYLYRKIQPKTWLGSFMNIAQNIIGIFPEISPGQA